MATNKLLPFANGVGANVTDYDTWSALSTLLSQGFTTGVARSDYANRVFAQGALASYILGQFVVDQTAQDADLNESVFYTNFKNALTAYITSKAVGLTGAQTVAGVKTFSDAVNLNNKVYISQNGAYGAEGADSYTFRAESTNTRSAYVSLCKTSSASNPGKVIISATDENNSAAHYYTFGFSEFSSSQPITCPTPAAGDNSTKAATTAFIANRETRLRQNILYASNSEVDISTTGTKSVCSVTLLADVSRVWLCIGFVDVDINDSSKHVDARLSSGGYSNWARTTAAGGGGLYAFGISSISSDTTATLQGTYSGTSDAKYMRGSLRAIPLY